MPERPPPIAGHQRYSTFHQSAADDETRRGWHHAYADALGSSASVADAGCGTGVFLDLLRERGVITRLGIDRDPDMVSQTKARGHVAICGDATTVLRSHAAHFDGIHLGHVIETHDGRGAIALVEAAADALRPDGLLVVRTLNWNNETVRNGAFWAEPWNVRPYLLETLHVMLSDAGLRVIAAGYEPGGWQNAYIIGRAPSRVIAAAVPRAAGAPLDVVFEGEMFSFNSMAQVNRELALPMARDPRVRLRLRPDEVRAEPSVAAEARFAPLRERVVRSIPACDVLIRQHCGEPEFTRPPGPRRVVQIFPWEYGALPVQWVRELDRNVDEIWTPSTYCRDMFLAAGLAPERVAVVPNGIDPAIFGPFDVAPYPLPAAKSFRFLYVGGTIHRKGVDVLIEAFARAFTADDDVTLVIKDFGTRSFYAGTNQGELAQRAAERPGTPQIVYLTDELAEADLVRLYRTCQAFAFPYRGEGFGLPMLEAMACGLPVVATAGGAADDFLDEEVAYLVPARRRSLGSTYGGRALAGEGWLLEPEMDELVATLRRVAAEPAAARERGARGSERARRDWTWAKAAQTAVARLAALSRAG